MKLHKNKKTLQSSQIIIGEYDDIVVKNPSVSLSPTLTRIEKVEHHIRIKAHKPIALKFWVESGVSVLCG